MIRLLFICTVLMSLLMTSRPVAADQPKVKLSGVFVSSVLYRTDSDFDPSTPYYDREGQSEGQAATFLRPDLLIQAGQQLSLFYQLELGWNAWSRNNPDQWFPAEDDYLVLKHRELWARWEFNDRWALTSGYQHLSEPSRLFLAHWGGAFTLDAAFDKSKMTVVAGQLPDSTWEGIDARDNNFLHDNFLIGILGTYDIKPNLRLDLGVYGVGDYRVVERPLYLLTGLAGIRIDTPTLQLWAHALGQLGAWKNSGVNGIDQSIMAWAFQAGLEHRPGPAHWSLNLLLLSPDDDHDGNNKSGAFFQSAKNRSPSLIMTEDEFRDRYDNLDERISTRLGAFGLNRAGLALADLAFGFQIGRWYHPILVQSAGFTLNPDNAMGNRFVGLETNLVNEFPLGERSSLILIGQMLWPGKAASVFVNEIDPEAVDPIFGAQFGFFARF